MYKVVLVAKENEADKLEACGKSYLDAVADLLTQIARSRDDTDEFECSVELLDLCSEIADYMHDADKCEVEHTDLDPAYSFTLTCWRL